jgi:hypothetical protein
VVQRGLLAAAGIGAMAPYAALAYGAWFNAAAIALGAAVLLRAHIAGRRLKGEAAGELSS